VKSRTSTQTMVCSFCWTSLLALLSLFSSLSPSLVLTVSDFFLALIFLLFCITCVCSLSLDVVVVLLGITNALHEVARGGKEEAMRWLLACGANPNAVIAGNSALLITTTKRNAVTSKLLVQHGADPHLKLNPKGLTALSKSTRSLHDIMVTTPPLRRREAAAPERLVINTTVVAPRAATPPPQPAPAPTPTPVPTDKLLSENLIHSTDVALQERVSGGHFGEVFRAAYVAAGGVLVAVKSLKNSNARELAREALFLKDMPHPNILTFYGIMFHNDAYWLVSEWADKGSLRDALAKDVLGHRTKGSKQHLQPKTLLRFAIQIGRLRSV
jgi:Protein tyrosine and serine/threonine kinase/Ankyrin repeat